jgi:hypothetical protein
MVHRAPSLESRPDLLYAAKLLHRIGNDYTRVILFASFVASRLQTNKRDPHCGM